MKIKWKNWKKMNLKKIYVIYNYNNIFSINNLISINNYKKNQIIIKNN